MHYIVVDFEWNQASRLPGNIDPPYPLTGEIIQMGAVKLDAQRNIVDRFQQVVKPVYFRVMNPNVQQLTGIATDLLETGVSFAEAIDQIREWAGNDQLFWFSWGFDDRLILKENLDLFEIEKGWMENWYDLQMIYRFQIDQSPNQAALKTAMDVLELTAPENLGEAHNAFFDAYCAGMIAGKMDLEQGMDQTKQYFLEHPPKQSNFLARTTVRGCKNHRAAYDAGRKLTLICPRCQAPLVNNQSWVCEKKNHTSFATLQRCSNAQCTTRRGRSEYFVRLKLIHNVNGKWQAVLLIYSATHSLVAKYMLKKRGQEKRKEAHCINCT